MDTHEVDQWGITEIKTVNFSYTWTIRNFSLNNKKIGQSLSSPKFYMPDNQDLKWFLVLYPKGRNEEYKDHISLFLHVKVLDDTNINTKVTLSVLSSEQKETHVRETNYTLKNSNGHGYDMFLKQSILFDLKNGLLTGDKLTVVCRVSAGVETIKNSSKEIVKFENNGNEFAISSELESLLKNKHMTDVTLIADGKELEAHKTILAARSPVFLAMLQTDMQEKQNSRIEFTDVSVDALSEMLHYLYTGTVKNIKKYAYDLLKLADKYDIKGLKRMCEILFFSKLSIDSAIKLFILADRYNLDVLRPSILKFMISNAKDILKTGLQKV